MGMSQIKKLSSATILKLAAGEIIDRPASIIKELIENALDAMATKIDIHLTQGGIADITVIDNGLGIHSQDLPHSIEAHATSKLQSYEDIDTVLTMGFRGEALASMAAVADIAIHSYNPQDDIGSELIKMNGEDMTIQPKARPQGTTVKVSHLFKRIPVRYRFLKSATTEATFITRLVEQFMMLHPNCSFKLTHNQNPVLSSHEGDDLNTVFANHIKVPINQVLSIQKTTQGIGVKGVMAPPNKTVKNRTKCWVSVNGRLVKSPLFYKAMDQALADVIPKGHYPLVVMNITCDTKMVDINIHPKKEDVKFTHPDDIFVAIKRAIQSAIHQPAREWVSASNPPLNTPNLTESHTFQDPHQAMGDDPPIQAMSVPGIDRSQTTIAPIIDRSFVNHPPSIHKKPSLNTTQESLSVPMTAPKEWVCLNKKYIVLPMADTLFIFDQHALHERILYDQFKEEYAQSRIVCMPLLIPEYIEIEANQYDMWQEVLPQFRAIGIDIDWFDDTQLIVREVPQMFAKVSIKTWLEDWQADLNQLVHAVESDVIEQLQMKSCKAAVKSGQRLHDEEVQALIQSAIHAKDQYTCPHGRPLYVKITESELDHRFLRS